MNSRAESITVKAGTAIATLELAEIPETPTPVASVATGANATQEQESMVWQLVEESGELTLEEKEQLCTLLIQNANLFAASQSDLGRTGQLSHTFTTNQANPVRQRVRRIPPHRRQEVKELLAKMQENDLIRPSCNPWASPVVLVQKVDGSLCLFVDYRKLNEVTTKDAYPLPRIDDSLNTLAGSQWFSTLDLASGYWQVEVAEQDREKTAFCRSEGLIEFNVMSFGLCNAPATFQQLMDLILAGLSWSQCLVYIDDLMVLGDAFTSHLKNLQAVFQRIHNTLRKVLTSTSILAYTDYTKPFILDTDASNTGIEGVLSQRDATGEEKVIAYANRALSKPERNYCVTCRELLAAVYFTKHF